MPRYRFVFKKTSSLKREAANWKTSKELERYIRGYQDEVGKAEINLKRGRSEAYEGPRRRKGDLKEEGKAPSRWKVPTYEGTGVLWTGGILGHKKSPGKAEPNKQMGWIRKLVGQWTALLQGKRRRKNDGVKLALSISPETLQELTSCGIAADLAAKEILSRGLEIYAGLHGWKKSQLGWLAGVHHDKDHLHLHILLFPTTQEGNPLRLSNRNHNEGIVRDDLTDLSGAVNVAAEEYYRMHLPTRVQEPEVQLAWWRGEPEATVPLPVPQDYRIENPGRGLLPPDELEALREKRKIESARKKRAAEILERETLENPRRWAALRRKGNPNLRPLQVPGSPELLAGGRIQGERAAPLKTWEKLLRRRIFNKVSDLKDSALKGEPSDVSPESSSPEKALRAVELIQNEMHTATSQLNRISEILEKSLEILMAKRQEEGLTPREKRRLAHQCRRLNKIKETLLDPVTRTRLLVDMQMAQSLPEEHHHHFQTQEGIQELEDVGIREANTFQKQSQKIISGAGTPAEEVKRLQQKADEIKPAMSRAKKEASLAIFLKTLILQTQKIQGNEGVQGIQGVQGVQGAEALRALELLIMGTKLRMEVVRDQIHAAKRRLKGRGPTLVPAKEPNPEDAQGEPILRPPEFLNPSRLKRVAASLRSLFEERRESLGKGIEPEADIPEASEKSRKIPSKDPQDILKAWKERPGQESLQSILLELQRKRDKEKGK
jgi:hypothetical protein